MQNLSRRQLLNSGAVLAGFAAINIPPAQAEDPDSLLFTSIKKGTQLQEEADTLREKCGEIYTALPPEYIMLGKCRVWETRDIVRYFANPTHLPDGQSAEDMIAEKISELLSTEKKHDEQKAFTDYDLLDTELLDKDRKTDDYWYIIQDYPVRTLRGLTEKMKYLALAFEEDKDLYAILIADAQRLG